MKQWQHKKELKAQIRAQQTAIGPYLFNAKPGLKPIRWIGTQRSVYTHRKKQKRIKEILGKLTTKGKQEPKISAKPIEMETQIKTEEAKHADEEMFEDLEPDSAEAVTVFVAKNAALLNNGLGMSYCIFVPEGYGMGLWRRLVYSGCKAIGEREYLKLMLECGRKVFPYDFPNTAAG